MELQTKTKMTISKLSDKVFDAIISQTEITEFWASKSSGFLEESKIVKWTFPDYDNAEVEITADKLEVGKKISFHWNTTGNKTQVEFKLTEKKGETLVEIQ